MRREKFGVVGRGPLAMAMPEMAYDSVSSFKTTSDLPQIKQTVRTFFPETWLWDIQTSKYFEN